MGRGILYFIFQRPRFFCCLPVRFGVITMSLLGILLSGILSVILWFEVSRAHPFPSSFIPSITCPEWCQRRERTYKQRARVFCGGGNRRNVPLPHLGCRVCLGHPLPPSKLSHETLTRALAVAFLARMQLHRRHRAQADLRNRLHGRAIRPLSDQPHCGVVPPRHDPAFHAHRHRRPMPARAQECPSTRPVCDALRFRSRPVRRPCVFHPRSGAL